MSITYNDRCGVHQIRPASYQAWFPIQQGRMPCPFAHNQASATSNIHVAQTIGQRQPFRGCACYGSAFVSRNLNWTGDPGQSAGLALHGKALALPVKHCTALHNTYDKDLDGQHGYLRHRCCRHIALPLSNMGFKLP